MPTIPTPIQVVGHEVGEWHITHDKLVQYMYALAEASDRVTIEEYARTYENRPLVLLTITSEANHNSIETIYETHLSLLYRARSGCAYIEELPAVVLLCTTVHGYERRGA